MNEEQEEAKQKIMREVEELHEGIRRTLEDEKLRYCPTAIVSALHLLLNSYVNGLSDGEKAASYTICNELYPKVHFHVRSAEISDTKH